MKAVNASNLRFDESSKVDIDHEDQDILRTQIGSLFDQSEPPTGIFALDDELARRVLLVLEERGISVPEDVSIIAPGDVLDYTKPYTPRITTMRINTDLIGSTTGELLLNRIRHAQEKLYVLKVNQELVERGSCAPPRIDSGRCAAGRGIALSLSRPRNSLICARTALGAGPPGRDLAAAQAAG
jgi:LacI family transcriptional regulator